MQVHRIGVGIGQNEAGADTARRADGAEDVRPIIAAVARCGRTRAPLRPDVGQGALLTDPRFVLPPELDRLAAGLGRNDGGDQSGMVFLCASWASGSASGWRGRTDRRRKRKPAQQLADPALVQLDAELPRDLLAQIDPRQRTTPSVSRSGPVRTHSATPPPAPPSASRARRRHAVGQTNRPDLRHCSDEPNRAASDGPSRSAAPPSRGSRLPSPAQSPASGAKLARQLCVPPPAASPTAWLRPRDRPRHHPLPSTEEGRTTPREPIQFTFESGARAGWYNTNRPMS